MEDDLLPKGFARLWRRARTARNPCSCWSKIPTTSALSILTITEERSIRTWCAKSPSQTCSATSFVRTEPRSLVEERRFSAALNGASELTRLWKGRSSTFLVFSCDPLEQIPLLLALPRLNVSCQVIHLTPTPLACIFFKKLPQRSLGFMGFEGSDFCFQMIANINNCGLWRKRNRLPVGQGKVRGHQIQFLCLVRRQPVPKLVRIPIRASGPMEGERGANSGHRMVRVPSHPTFRASPKHYTRAELAHMQTPL